MNHYFVTTTLGRIYVQYVMWQIPKWNFLCLEGSRQAKLRLSLVSIVDSIEETWEGLQHNLTHLKGRSLWHNKWIKFVAAVTEEKQLREYYRANENNQYYCYCITSPTCNRYHCCSQIKIWTCSSDKSLSEMIIKVITEIAE